MGPPNSHCKSWHHPDKQPQIWNNPGEQCPLTTEKLQVLHAAQKKNIVKVGTDLTMESIPYKKGPEILASSHLRWSLALPNLSSNSSSHGIINTLDDVELSNVWAESCSDTKTIELDQSLLEGSVTPILSIACTSCFSGSTRLSGSQTYRLICLVQVSNKCCWDQFLQVSLEIVSKTMFYLIQLDVSSGFRCCGIS